MNANEVIANLAGEGAHPNDHVNLGQSSNDVFPSAVHLAALGEVNDDLLPADRRPRGGAHRQGRGVRRPRQVGAHPPDGRGPGDARPGVRAATPRRFASAARGSATRSGASARSRSAAPRPGTGINTHAEFADGRAREADRGDRASRSRRPRIRSRATRSRDSLVELSGALKVLAVSLIKIGGDLALMGSGPRAGLAEIRLPELQKGSSIMPGKVNPVIPEVTIQVGDQVIGNDAAISIAGTQGQFELNVRVPLIARNLLDSIKLLAAAVPPARHQVRERDRAERGDARAPRGVERPDRDRAQPAHRLRQDDRDRQGGRRLGRGRCARSRREAGRRRRRSSTSRSTQKKLARPHD